MKGPDNNSLEEPGTGSPGSTPPTLLDRVKAGDQGSCWRLVSLYSPLVYHRYLARVPAEDRREILQDVFATVFAKIGDFERRFDGPAFRGWLYRITYFKVGDYLRQRRREMRVSPHAAGMPPRGGTGRPRSEPGPGGYADERRLLVRRILETIRSEFEPASYDMAWRQLIEGQPAGVVAEALGKSTNSAYIAKSRVLRRVRELMMELGELGGATAPEDRLSGGG